jgi:flagellar biosynthesis/type III secretory pathway protein FliH
MLGAVALIAGLAVAGYAIGSSSAPDAADATADRRAAYRNAYGSALADARDRSRAKAKEQGITQGRAQGNHAGARAGLTKGEAFVQVQLEMAAAAEANQAAPAADTASSELVPCEANNGLCTPEQMQQLAAGECGATCPAAP